MHICYLDESGSYARQGTTPYFVLLGLSIPASTWKSKDADIAKLLDRHSVYGEIHTAWMARKYPEQERVADFSKLSHTDRRVAVERERKIDAGKAGLRGRDAVQTLLRNYRKTNAYIHLTHAERLDTLRALADQIASWHDAALFCDAQRKSAHPSSHADETILEHAFEQVVSRYHTYLDRIHADLGLIVQDRNDTAATRLTTLARKYHAKGTSYGQVSRLVETPLFVDSQLTSMVQLADLAAYAVRRFFENQERDLLDRLYPRFDRAQKRLVGIRHFTGKQACTCHICKDHGRALGGA